MFGVGDDDVDDVDIQLAPHVRISEKLLRICFTPTVGWV